ncbi:fimbrial assembly chaperone [Enterobacter kobei]|uniref:fimbrial assembly chaperone n=1 Tax=Enterobacter kobei TaxID=208224 RepID=UPI000EF1ED08|nr:fimbrial assembly chaperone [Enterobacter kobei]AYL06941.1 fimbrial assembly chaperone [Enterobacter kobei]
MRNYKLLLVSSRLAMAGLLMLGVSAEAFGVVNADRTRVIFSANDITQSLNLSNDGETPVMIQVWTDAGNPLVPPDKVSTPVIVTPPVFRMLPKEMRSLRLLLTSRQALPGDRESVFWLNIFQIQPENGQIQQQEQKIMLPLRFRMKVFIRPAGLGAPDAREYQKLRFTARGSWLILQNPTTWNISLNIQIPGHHPLNNLMVSPRAERTVSLDKPASPGEVLTYSVITDDGNYREYQAAIQK